MRLNEDKRIEHAVPFLKEGTVLFVSPDPAQRIDKPGCTVLSDLIDTLSPDIRQYLFPGSDPVLSVEDAYRRVRELAGLGDQTGVLYRLDGVLYFHPLAEGAELDIDTLLSRPLESRVVERRASRHSKAPSPRAILSEETILFSVVGDESEQSEKSEKEEAPDPRVQAILDAWRKIEREFGVTIEDVQILLGYKVKLSRLRITPAGKLFLTDFDNQEVKMDDLTKALYFFYLRHLEGARLKDLQDHADEILHLYSRITGRDDPDKIRESVRNLLDPFGNGLNVSMSRIKKAFKDIVGDRIARFYYITGPSGEVRKIGLDRDLVIWEH